MNFTNNFESSLLHAISNKALFTYRMSRQEVEACAIERLLYDLRPSPENLMVRAGPGRCMFCVEGYDDDPKELFEVPEFVAFVRKVNESSPCWIYFAHPGFQRLPASRWLSLIAFCSSNNAEVVRQAGIDKFRFACSEPEIK